MHNVDCAICMDLGFVIVKKGIYDFKYKCKCRRSEEHTYEGSECKQTSKYYCACVDELPSGTVEELIDMNEKNAGLKRSAGRWLKPVGNKISESEVAKYKKMFSGIVANEPEPETEEWTV